MAITDDQMDELIDYARQMGKDGVLASVYHTDQQVIDAVFDYAQINNMRTEDEFDAIITEQDMPAPDDRRDILAAWHEGHAQFCNSQAT